MEIKPIKQFNKTVYVAPDKSITHRAIMFNSIANGQSVISNALLGDDCLSTIDCMKKLGASIAVDGDKIFIKGTNKLSDSELYVGNSGTTMRLMSGLLAGYNGRFVLDGDCSIRKRPMNRVINPLNQMGANIQANDGKAPIYINGGNLQAIDYSMPMASAQVKSAILLAGLKAHGTTIVREKIQSRNHTEIMLKAMGADIKILDNNIFINKSDLKAVDVKVPNDISSAVYPLVLALIVKGASVTCKDVCLNPTRTGILDVFKMCGADITTVITDNKSELTGNITAKYSDLHPFIIDKNLIPRLIDEIPTLAVLGCFIKGQSIIKGAEELKVKESNRIDSTVNFLKEMGADIQATSDGMIINGSGSLIGGCEIDSVNDHRIAMSMAVAGWASQKGVNILNSDCVNISYPDFYKLVEA